MSRHPRPALYISHSIHYYPFGLALSGAAANTVPAEAISKAQYNGGSLLEDELLDAGEAEGANYATPYRRYDPAIGRLLGVDPLADQYADLSTGCFAGNDPVNQNDPTGAFISDTDPSARGYDRFLYDTGRYGQFDADGGSGSGGGDGAPWWMGRGMGLGYKPSVADWQRVPQSRWGVTLTTRDFKRAIVNRATGEETGVEFWSETDVSGLWGVDMGGGQVERQGGGNGSPLPGGGNSQNSILDAMGQFSGTSMYLGAAIYDVGGRLLS